MSFIKNDLPEIAFQNHEMVIKEQSAFLIDMEALLLQNNLFETDLHFLHHCIKKLSLVNLIFESWRNFKICKKPLRNNLQIEFAEIFTKLRLKRLENQTIAIRLPAQRICNNICFTWSIIDARIIVLNHFHPTNLTKVVVGLSENVLQALVVSVHLHWSS